MNLINRYLQKIIALWVSSNLDSVKNYLIICAHTINSFNQDIFALLFSSHFDRNKKNLQINDNRDIYKTSRLYN